MGSAEMLHQSHPLLQLSRVSPQKTTLTSVYDTNFSVKTVLHVLAAMIKKLNAPQTMSRSTVNGLLPLEVPLCLITSILEAAEARASHLQQHLQGEIRDIDHLLLLQNLEADVTKMS